MMSLYILLIVLLIIHYVVHINCNIETGMSFPLDTRDKSSNLFIIGLRFIGPTAFQPAENPSGAIRCQIFSKVTLPSLVALNIPIRSTLNIVLINESVILEPTCMKVIEKARSLLGKRLYFADSTKTFYTNFNLDADYIFYSRLDTDDAMHPKTLSSIHDNFMNSGMPFAVLSPYFGNLWYPTEGTGCGEILYNTNLRRYPVMQTSAFHKEAFKRIMNMKSDKDMLNYISRLPGIQTIPYHFEHLTPEQIFTTLNQNIKSNKTNFDLNVHDCILYFNVWEVNGVPGILYTQTGLQSSLMRRGWKSTHHLKWYDRYVKREGDPDVCDTIEKFGISSKEVTELRRLIEKDHLRFSMNGLNAGGMHTNESHYDEPK